MWKHDVFVGFSLCITILLADCLERDSPRDQLVVTLFLLTVFGLLLGAGVKNRMMKAGLSADMSWNTGRRWWEVSVCTSTVVHRPLTGEHTAINQSWMPHQQTYELGLSRFGYSADRDVRMRDYIPVSSETPRQNT
jgi:hypothetical protein